MSPWSAIVFSQVFGESAVWDVGFAAHDGLHASHQKDIDWTEADLNHRRKPTNYEINQDEGFVIYHRFHRLVRASVANQFG